MQRFLPWLALFLLSVSSPLSAQTDPDYRIHSALREDGRVYLRWAPATGFAFRQLLDGRLNVEIHRVDGGRIHLVEKLRPRPLPLADYLAAATTIYDSVSIAHLYYDEVSGEDWESLQDEEVRALRGEQRDFELLLNHNFSPLNDWNSTLRSGQGWAQSAGAMGVGMAVKVYPTASGDTLYHQLSFTDYEPPQLPELTGKFNNRRAKLQWRTYELDDTYWGWHLEQSVDGGPYRPVTTAPYMNIAAAQLEGDVPEALKSLYRTVPIAANGVPITYRLRGQDFLGFRSENYAELTGEGFEDVAFSPSIRRTIQTDSNYAVIQWDFDEKQNKMVDYFRIIVADSAGGKYVTVRDRIGPEVREVAVPMEYSSNFYRIQLITKSGRTISSFESLVMAYDDEPPAVPRDFTGYIDTAGIAHFTWVRSNEPDLAGYYLFKGYYGDTELAMITPDPLPGPEYIDTVNLINPTEHVYYQLRSVDTRGNGSAFSPKLKLKKPDVYPPVAPQFRGGEAVEAGIEMSWVGSPSDDVVRYEIIRTEAGSSAPATTVLAYDTSALRSSFLDTDVLPDVTYRYVIRAIDDDELRSDDSQPLTVAMSDFGLRAAIEDIRISSQAEAGTVTLSWTYAAAPAEFYVYRAEDDRPVSLLKVISGTERQFVDKTVRGKRAYRYLLQAVFADGGVSPFSGEVAVEGLE